MKVFVVSLARSADRRKHMIAHLTQRGVDFEIFDAIEGALLSEEEIQKYCDMDALEKHAKWLNRGTIGACLSHYFIFKRIIELNLPSACIIEDDIIVDKNFDKLLNAIDSSVIQDKKLTLLYYTSWNKIELETLNRSLSGEFGLYKIRNYEGLNSSAGYIVSQEACKRLVNVVLPIRMGPDNWAEFKRLGVMDEVTCIFPQPLNNTHAKSSIEYLEAKSMTSKVADFVDKNKIFPFYQLLKQRRKMMSEKMMNIKIVS
ncbi:MAG: glycosyltransferase family 25 protein [Sphingobacteriales bacterium]|nr:MAG: glycosyltransferase family 25 protein [Sphingobacteriales bacterium]